MGGPLLAHTCQLAGPYASFDIPCQYLEVWNTIYNVRAGKDYLDLLVEPITAGHCTMNSLMNSSL